MFDVYVYEEDDPTGDPRPSVVTSWIRGLDDRHKKTFGNLIKRHAEYGPIKDERKSKELGDGVFEFKSHDGAGERLAYFYLPGRRTVLSHGFKKGDSVQPQITRAQVLRARLVEEIQ